MIMAKQIKKEDLFESKLLDDVIKDAERAITVFDKLDAELSKVAQNFATILKNSNKLSKSGISELINSSNQLNQITLETLKLERDKIKNEKTIKQAQEERWKAEQSLQKQRERGIAQMQKEAKQAQEMARPYNQLSARLNQLRKDYKDLALSGNEYTASGRKMKAEIDSLDKSLKKVDGSVGQFQRNVGNYKKGFDSLTSTLAKLGLGFSVFEGIRAFATTEIRLQSMQLALKNVLKTTDQYNKSFKFLTDLSKDYGQDLLVLTDSYKSFIASSESSNLPIEERNRIYQALIKAGSSLALSNDQIGGSLTAMQQMFSKGKVTAEELTGQLGERLPGAIGLMSEAMGVGEKELFKMMQSGDLLANDALPKLATVLEKHYGATAKNNLQTISGAWNALSTQISLYINDANKGGAITKQIAGSIAFLGKNLDSIIQVLKVAIRQFIIYKIVQSDLVKGGASFIAGLFKTNKALTENAVATEKASGASSRFKESLKAIGWQTAIIGATELAIKLYDIVSGAEDARLAMDKYNKAISGGQKFGSDLANSINKKALEETDALTKKFNESKGKMSQKTYDKELELINRNKNARIKAEIQFEIQDKERAKKQLLNLENYYKEAMQANPLFRSASDERIIQKYQNYKNEINQSNTVIKELLSLYDESNRVIQESPITKGDATKKQKEYNTELNKTNEYLSQQTELLNESARIDSENRISLKSEQLDIELQKQIDNINKGNEYDYVELWRLLDEKKKLRLDALDAESQQEIDALTEKYRLLGVEEKNAIEANKAELLKAGGDKAKIEASYQEQIKIYEENELQRKGDLELEKENILKKGGQKRNEILKEEANLEIDLNGKIADEVKKKQEEKEKLQKEADEKEKARLKEMQDLRKYLINEILDEWKKASQEKENLLQKEVDAQAKQQDNLQAMANAGNIQAQQSIAASIQAQQKATVEKNKEAEKQRRIEEIQMFYNMIENKLDKDVSAPKAISQSLAEFGIIKGAVRLLKGFYKGTKGLLKDENTPIHGGKDGHMIMADGNEMIVNPDHTSKLASVGINKTDDLVNSALMYKMNLGGFQMNPHQIRKVEQNNSDKYLKKMVEIMENKAEFYLDPIIIDGIARGVQSTSIKGNITKYSSYIPKL